MPLSLLSCFTDIFLCQSHDSCKWDWVSFSSQTKQKSKFMCTIGGQFSYFCKQDTVTCWETRSHWCLSTWWGFAALFIPLSSEVLYWLPWHPHHNIIIVVAVRLRSSEFNWEIQFVQAQKLVTMSLSVLARKENKEEKICSWKRNTKWSVYLNVV